MVRKRGLPTIGELVICRITKINPNSAFAVLEEYGKEGMVHISEISRGWVRDIRKHLKSDQTVIAKVINVDRAAVGLSIKRVDDKQKNEKMKEFKLNNKAEMMLDIVAKKLGKTLDQAYQEAGFILQESCGSLYEGFKKSLKNPDQLKERGVPADWVDQIRIIAEKSIEQKEFELKKKLILKSAKPNGVVLIKDLLKKAADMGFSVTYISAPEYLVKYKTKDVKTGNKEFSDKLEKITDMAKSHDIEVL